MSIATDTATTTVVFRNGLSRTIPTDLAARVIGMSAERRIVVQDEGFPWTFGLTLCCNAYDKGTEHGAACRACYGDDAGEYNAVVKHPVLDPAECEPLFDAMWKGERMGFSEKQIRDSLASHERDLVLVQAGRIRPHKIIGTGYKQPKKLAIQWLTDQIAECKRDLASRGRTHTVNACNVAYVIRNATTD